ncbi:BlaI/MecI/CopY family transcriptional regulator [Pseudonocardia adelaidensis]|uniref:BlaI/MecI/CopY family transcriptional regulator n=1 Tax=Pseudonocardia adelaidensis TaxID=648754 RepID=A0ABP9NS08_9PSEU
MGRGRGELESAVMSVLWAQSGPVTARTVLREIGDADLAYTTVKTVLERLTRKGVVARVSVDRSWRYSAAAPRADYVAELMLSALDHSGDRDAALVRFARSVSPAEAGVLRAALDDAERGDE